MRTKFLGKLNLTEQKNHISTQWLKPACQDHNFSPKTHLDLLTFIPYKTVPSRKRMIFIFIENVQILL